MSDPDYSSIKVHVMWETIGGDKHRGELVEIDSNVAIVQCHDGERRAVEDCGVKVCCPSCEGSGRYSVPSDGYENSKSGHCGDCGGDGDLRAFAVRNLDSLILRRDKLQSSKDSIDAEIQFSDFWIDYARDSLTPDSTPGHDAMSRGEAGVPSVSFDNGNSGFSRGHYAGLHCEFCSQPAYETQGGYELCCTHAVMFGSRSEWGGLKSLPPRVGPPDREIK